MKHIHWIKDLVIVGVIFGATFVSFRGQLSEQREKFEGEVAGLQTQVSELHAKIEGVTSDQEKTALSLKEVQNREVVKQKSQDELLTAAVAKVSPAVVSVVVAKDVPKLEVVYKNPFGDDPFFKDFDVRVPVYQQKGVERQRVGAGTGFIISENGYILTNKHVVADTAAAYTVLLNDGTQKQASVIYRDPNTDIAVIKIEGSGFRKAAFGNSDSLQLGQTVMAIGNALGEYNNSVSVGIISGLNRKLEGAGQTLAGVIQTDAAVNPGNSGGPLLDLNGRVMGVNVATVIGSNSISFAIPANIVKAVVESTVGRQ